MKSSTPVHGLLPVLKQPGLTSHDVVARARRLLGTRRIGHTGTLDPGAAGVLVLMVGRATRLAELLQAEDKAYVAEMYLGVATDTQDGYGTRLPTAGTTVPGEQRLRDVVRRFVGPLKQVPPMASAVRKDGRRLYELARAGVEVDRPARQVYVDRLDVLRIAPGADKGDASSLGTGTRVTMRVDCSKGTYVRTLCHDIGEALGCGAYMSFLLRTGAGAVDLAMTRTLDDLEREAKAGPIALLPADAALGHVPARSLTEAGARAVQHGQTIGPEHFDEAAAANERSSDAPATSPRPRPGADMLRLYDAAGMFLALARPHPDRSGRWRPRIVFRDERGNARD